MSVERFNQEVWGVLQEVKLNILRARDGAPLIKYKINSPKSIIKELNFLEPELIILEKLASWGAIKIIENPFKYASDFYEGIRRIATTSQPIPNISILEYAERFDVIFLAILPKFDEVYKKYEELNKEKNNTKIESKERRDGGEKTSITRDKNGDFYYKNKPIKFDNKEAIYYLIFECLYEKGDFEGFCSYEAIDKYLVRQGQKEISDDLPIKNRVKNGITNLKRFSGLPKKALDGKETIQKRRGKGVILYNP